MKKILAILGFVLISQLSFAQAWNGSNDRKVQAGLNAWGFGSGITGTYDHGINNLLSIGAGANFYFGDNHNSSGFFLFGRLNAHLQDALKLSDKIDIYPGVDVGFHGNGFGLGAHIGARYFFSQKFGVFAEIGNNGSLGVSINL